MLNANRTWLRPRYGVALLLLAICDCNQASDGPSKNASQQSSEVDVANGTDKGVSPPDAIGGAYLVPVGLVSSTFVLKAISAIANLNANGGLPPEASGAARQPHESDDSLVGTLDKAQFNGNLDFYYSQASFGVESLLYLVSTRDFLAQTFGANGLFSMKSIRVMQADAASGRRFRLPPGITFGKDGLTLDTVSVRVLPAERYPYVLDFFRASKASPGSMYRGVSLRFALDSDAGTDIKVVLNALEGDPGTMSQVLTEVAYDTALPECTVTYSVLATMPQMYTVYQFGGAYTGTLLAGIQTPATPQDPNPAGLPLPLQMRENDMYLSRSVVKTGAPLNASSLAFIPAAEASTVGLNPGPSIWTTHDFGRAMTASVIGFLRDPAVTPACQSAGADLRTQASANGMVPPASLTTAPSSFCAGNTALTDAALAGIINDYCLAPPWPRFAVNLTVDGKSYSRDACQDQFFSLTFQNPMFGWQQTQPSATDPVGLDLGYGTYFYQTAPTEVLVHQALTATERDLQTALELLTLTDVSRIKQPYLYDPALVAAAAFNNAPPVSP